MASNEFQNRLLRAMNNQAHAMITFGEELNESLNGNRFIAIDMTTIATGLSFDVGITTPSDKDVRFLWIDLGCDLNFAKCILYEGVTFTGSTQIVPINSNRQSAKTAQTIIHSAFSVTPDITGAVIVDTVATLGGTGVGQSSSGGAQEGDGFLLLKKNTKYLLRVSNEDGTTANVLLKIPFIETTLTD